MEDLKDTLDSTKWVKLDVSQKTDFQEFKVMRQHKKLSSNSIGYLIQTDPEEEPKGVIIQFTVNDKDPLKNIGTAELRLKDDKIIGIDLDGDCFEMK